MSLELGQCTNVLWALSELLLLCMRLRRIFKPKELTLTQVRYGDLTEHQHSVLVELGQINGCGTRSGPLNVPDWSFTASCYHHDFNYWLGGTKEDRAKADWQFYQAMLVDANNAPWYKRYWYAMMAWVYYRAVRWYSWRLWPDYEMRTLEDLEELVAEYDASTS